MAAGGDDGQKGDGELNIFARGISPISPLGVVSCDSPVLFGPAQKYFAQGSERAQRTPSGKKRRALGSASYLTERLVGIVRASGLLGVQSSGGKATRQKVGRGAVNSRPISALPPRTGPRNATWHSCSSSVLLCRT